MTDVSGRGVGMDVVRTNIEALGGTVDFDTEVGRGSTRNIALPLTLAIIPFLEVRNGSQRFAVPRSNISELFHRVSYGRDADLRTAVIEAITTNETLFFRDATPFEALRHKALPEMFDAVQAVPNPRRVRIWSAACSTGQEPYSIARTLHELLPDIHAAWEVQVLATGISDQVVRHASRGVHSELEISRGMPRTRLQRWCEKGPGGWRVTDEIRTLVRSERRNLLEPFVDVGPFDVISCRNVAIHFEPDVQRDLLHRLTERRWPHGGLFVGASESPARFGPRLVPQQHCRAVFDRPNLGAADARRRTGRARREDVREAARALSPASSRAAPGGRGTRSRRRRRDPRAARR